MLSEIQILRKLSEIKENDFTTKLYDVITPEINSSNDDVIECIFLVMEYAGITLSRTLDNIT